MPRGWTVYEIPSTRLVSQTPSTFGASSSAARRSAAAALRASLASVHFLVSVWEPCPLASRRCHPPRGRGGDRDRVLGAARRGDSWHGSRTVLSQDASSSSSLQPMSRPPGMRRLQSRPSVAIYLNSEQHSVRPGVLILSPSSPRVRSHQGPRVSAPVEDGDGKTQAQGTSPCLLLEGLQGENDGGSGTCVPCCRASLGTSSLLNKESDDTTSNSIGEAHCIFTPS